MSFTESQKPMRRPGVPLAPMLDVLFLLLIFFVTTSSFRAEEYEIEVQLPAAEASEPAEARRTEVVINVRADGSILIGQRPFEVAELRATLRQLVADFPDEHVIIRGDRTSTYERIVEVMDSARAAGVRNIYFATVRSAEEIGS